MEALDPSVMIGCRWWLSFADKEREPLPLNWGRWHPCHIIQARCLAHLAKAKAKQHGAHSAIRPHISTGITPQLTCQSARGPDNLPPGDRQTERAGTR